MPAWIVIYRRHLTQSGLRDGHCQAVPKSPSLRTLCLCVKLSDPFLPTFPLSPIFRIFFQVPYPATPLFATLAKTAGVCTNNSHSGTHQSRLQSAHMSDCLYPLSPIPYTLSPFFSHSCALFCAFLHSPKTQLFSFQSLPHSSSKNKGRAIC